MISVMGLCVWLVQNPFPWPEAGRAADSYVAIGRGLYSDYIEVARLHWSAAQAGPCDEGLSTDSDGSVCTAIPFIPDPTKPVMPGVLFLAYQSLVYDAPRSLSRPKASLALSWHFTLISGGVIWEMIVNASGVTHSIMLAEYREIRTRKQIAPLIFLEVKLLQPRRVQHVEVKPNGEYTLQVHDISQWSLPSNLLSLGLMYFAWPNQPTCGTFTHLYTTKPAAFINGLFSSFPDAATILEGDRQKIVTPVLGFRGCGEFPYAFWYRQMVYRDPPTPSLYIDGPPVEIWSFTAARENPNDLITDPDTTIAHRKVRAVRDDLRELGFEGPFMPDPDLLPILEAREALDSQNYKSGRAMGDFAMSMMELVSENPENQLMAEFVNRVIGPNVEHIDHLGDTEIEFNPFLEHCTAEPIPHQLPILGAHFFEEPGTDCGFCVYHDRIVANPFQSWAHSKMLTMDWSWDGIHGGRGDIYQKAYLFAESVILGNGRNATAISNEIGRQISEEAQQGQLPPLTVKALENIPSEATTNTTESATGELIPPFFRGGYNPCMDPSNTFEYLFLFEGIQSIFDLPCGLLWGVLGF